MRIEPSWGEERKHRRSEVVIIVPQVWTLLWKVGISTILVALAVTVVPGYEAVDRTLVDLAIVTMFIGFTGPFFVQYLRTWWMILSGDLEGSPDGS